ncbi:hypothetical protein ACF08B_28635 [Streptomyces sp. NPDC015139]|uniref:hypothetical protein n=1 Tax=Streptomyces sp. NPDC015139 TaxID=3364942 RepID=UPI0036FD3C7F
MPHETTVRQLIHQLQAVDPDRPVYLAINPDWPQTHRVGRVIQISDSDGAVYLAENGQEDVLPSEVRAQLGWADV